MPAPNNPPRGWLLVHPGFHKMLANAVRRLDDSVCADGLDTMVALGSYLDSPVDPSLSAAATLVISIGEMATGRLNDALRELASAGVGDPGVSTAVVDDGAPTQRGKGGLPPPARAKQEIADVLLVVEEFRKHVADPGLRLGTAEGKKRDQVLVDLLITANTLRQLIGAIERGIVCS